MSKRHAMSPEHIQRYRNLLAELDRKRSTSQLDLHGRLKKCEGPDWGYRFTCRSPACPRCRDRYIARQRREAQKRFSGATNTDLLMVSIVLGATDNIRDVGLIYDKGRRDLRNLVNRHRRSSVAWNGFEFVGWLEVDAYDPADFSLLGSDKIIQLEELLSDTTDAIGPIWSPTIHAIVRVPPSLNYDDVRSAFETQWHRHRQVDVRNFHLDKSVSKNIGNIVNYANKHECMTGPSGFRSAWETSWQVQFYDWLHQFSRGFHSMRVNVGSSKINISDTDIITVEQGSCEDYNRSSDEPAVFVPLDDHRDRVPTNNTKQRDIPSQEPAQVSKVRDVSKPIVDQVRVLRPKDHDRTEIDDIVESPIASAFGTGSEFGQLSL